MKKTLLLIIASLMLFGCVVAIMHYQVFDQVATRKELVICNETVTSISIETGDGTQFVLAKKDNGKWCISTDKLQCKANIFAINNLLFELDVAVRGGTVLEKKDWPHSSEYFIRVNIAGSNHVLYCETGSVVADIISGDLFNFVDSKVFTVNAGMTELFIKVPEQNLEYRFVRRSDVFFLDCAAQLQVDSTLMSEVISHLKTLHFTKFADAGELFGGEYAEIKIYDSKRCESIKFVRNGERVIAIKDGLDIAIELNTEDLSQFVDSVCAAASVRVFPKMKIDTIEVLDNVTQKEFFLQKLEEINVWNLITKNNGKIVNFRADSTAVSELIDVLFNMQSVNIFDEKSINLSEFNKKLSINLDGDHVIKFDVFERNNHIIGILGDSKVVFEINNSLDDILSQGRGFFRDKTLFDLPAGSSVYDISIAKIDSEDDKHCFVSCDPRVVKLVEYANKFFVKNYVEDFEIIQRTIKFKESSVSLDWKLEFDIELAGVGETKCEKICIKFNRPKSTNGKMFGCYELQGTVFEFTDTLRDAILRLM